MAGLLIEVSLLDLYVDPRSRAKCMFVNKFEKNIVMSFSVNNSHLALQSKKILTPPYYRDYNHKVSTDKQVQSRSDDSGATMHIVRASNMGRIVDFFKHAPFFLTQID